MKKSSKLTISIILIFSLLLVANFLPARNVYSTVDAPARVPYYEDCTFQFGTATVDGHIKKCRDWRILGCTPETLCHAKVVADPDPDGGV
jgi:hypothetical protein